MGTTFTMRMNESQKTLISEYAAMHGKSMAEFMLESTLSVIEDAIDLRDWREAKAEFDRDPVIVRLTRYSRDIADSLAMPGASDIEFEPQRITFSIQPADFS